MAATTDDNESELAPDIPAKVRDPATFFQRRRPLFWAALTWMSGVAADDALALSAFHSTLTALSVSAAALLLFFVLKSKRRELAAFAMLAFAAGFGTHAAIARILPDHHIARATTEAENSYVLRGVVSDVSRLPSGAARWTLNADFLAHAMDVEPKWKAVTGRVQLYIPRAPATVREGTRVEVRAELRKPIDTFPDDFNLESYLQREGIYRSGSVEIESGIRTLETSRNPLFALRRFSATCSDRLSAAMPAYALEGRSPGSQAALLSALLFGRKEFLDRSDRDAFSSTGTAHLLAISGLQIQFLAWLLWLVFQRCGIPRRTAAIALVALTWLYVALTGAEPPIVRAAVMISLALLGRILWREADPLTLLGASALCILAIAPDQLFQAGFQLSFSAVFALVTLGPLLKELLNQRDPLEIIEPVTTAGISPRGLREEFGNVALISFVAWLGTLPVIAFHMQQFTVLGVFTNLVAVPLSTLAMVAGLIVLLAGIVSSTFAAQLAWAPFALIALLQLLTENIAQIPIASLRVAPPHPAVLVVCCLLVLFLWIERRRHSTRKVTFVLPLLFAASISAGALFIERPTRAITFLDLPRSRAVLIQEGADGVLIDAGNPSSAHRLARWIEAQGVTRLRKIIITENEWSTHGGVTQLLRRLPVDEVVLPQVAAPDMQRRALEAELNARNIKWTMRPVREPQQLLSSFRFQLIDDADPAPLKVITESGIAVRVEQGTQSLVVLPARSMASLERFQKNAPRGFFETQTLFLPAGPFERFPRTAANLIRQSGCVYFISPARPQFEVESPNLRGETVLKYGSARLLVEDGGWIRESFWDGQWVRRQ